MSTYLEPRTFRQLQESGTLPAPSGVRLNIMQMCQQEDLSLPDLVRQVLGDPMLSGRLIQIANIPNVNKGRMVASINIELLLMVGLQSVRQMALAISLIDSPRRSDCGAFDHSAFWARSTAMACAGQALAEMLPRVPAAEMFTNGLLAGIGRLALASVHGERYGALLEGPEDGGALRIKEKAAFGVDHLQLAAAMMEDWHFPPLFCTAVLHHEQPDASGFAEEERQQQLVRMLALAGGFADVCVAADARARAAVLPRLIEQAAAFALPLSGLEYLCSRISADWSDWGALLQVPARTLPVMAGELATAAERMGAAQAAH